MLTPRQLFCAVIAGVATVYVMFLLVVTVAWLLFLEAQ